MNDLPRICWFRTAPAGLWTAGWLHDWSVDFEELNDGVGHYPAAVVSHFDTGMVRAVPVSFICLAKEKPQ